MKIYTRTGDKGTTGLYGGKRVSKNSLRVEAYGTMDELHATIGVVMTMIKDKKSKLRPYLRDIQQDLFEICFLLANPKAKSPNWVVGRVETMEHIIDELTKELPELRNFIYLDGGKAGSFLHLARSICRRLERRIVALSQKEKVDKDVLQYFNRLSDLLFTMARFVNYKEGVKERIWKGLR